MRVEKRSEDVTQLMRWGTIDGEVGLLAPARPENRKGSRSLLTFQVVSQAPFAGKVTKNMFRMRGFCGL